MNKLLFIVMLKFCIMSLALEVYAQNIDFENIDENIEQKANPELLSEEKPPYGIVFGMGYRYMHSSYTVERPSTETSGLVEIIKQSSGYQAFFLNLKFTAMLWDNFGLFFNMNLNFPLTIVESVYPNTDSTDSEPEIVNSIFLLKNMPNVVGFKGLGLEWLMGPVYEIYHNEITFYVEGGLATNVTQEDFTLEEMRKNWGLGIGIDLGVEIYLASFFGLGFGIQGHYYPLTIMDVNNTLTDADTGVKYEIKTNSTVNLGAYLSTAWYF